MNQEALKQILSTRYDRASWQSVLTEVFGVRELHQNPRTIPLPKNEIAASAVELGSIETEDGRLVGLYHVELTDKPRIWQNRVGLRNLLKKVYSNDVDAALVVFVKGGQWRLSFISEIRILKADGRLETESTEPKRFTYLLGSGQKATTAAQRLSALAGHTYSLDEIKKAFSVEALNKEFYGKVSKKFYELVGATEGKGKKQVNHERILKLPSTPHAAKTKYQEFAVRLIGRIVFCWFLKEKKSKAGNPLIPPGLIESSAVKKQYYHSILEPLFFETLNTPMNSRLDELPAGCERVPFLNGGLFEPHLEDHYEMNKRTSISNHINTLAIPDQWFRDFFSMLEEYNFTLDENSPVDVEISVDPEMLGRIFENLLAEIDPDSGESARKATGSFYTPREIVNYMVDESLILYLKGKLQTETIGFAAIGEDQTTFWGNEARGGQLKLETSSTIWHGKDDELDAKLRSLLSYSDDENPFNENDTEILIREIDSCKILDPACGSGAFPIGILQRLVFLLGKLDPEDKNGSGKKSKWRQWQEIKAKKEAADAIGIVDKNARAERLKEISDIFELNTSDFGRKLFLIENCIYGVDIQPVAAEISKLRCFLTLIVDETIDDDESNRGVKPLPNLEFKFVTADTLLRLPAATKQADLFNTNDQEQLNRLALIRHDYINSSGEQKEKLKRDFEKVQTELYDKLIKESSRQNPRAVALSTWKPFDYSITNWFDPTWMFGVEGFDLVIGNPPYISLSKDAGYLSKRYLNSNFRTLDRTGDIYCLFYERGFELLKSVGNLCFITSNKWMRAGYGEATRQFFAECTNPVLLVDFAGQKVFDSATVDTNILLFKKGKNVGKTTACTIRENALNQLSVFVSQNSAEIHLDGDASWVILSPTEKRIREKIESVGKPLKDWGIEIYRGILTGYNQAFIIDSSTRKMLIDNDPKSAEIIRPILRGRDIKRFGYTFGERWLINTHNGIRSSGIKPIDINDYQAVKAHLDAFYHDLERRADKGDTPYNLRNCAYMEDFGRQKIIWGEISDKTKFALDLNGDYTAEATTFILVGSSLLYLVGYLNSRFSEYYFSQIGTTTGVGTVRWKKFTIERLPVPVISAESRERLEAIVKQIIERQSKQMSFDDLEKKMNCLVYEYIGLSDSEIELIEAFGS